MKTEELFECGRLLALEDDNTINREQTLRLITLKAIAKRDLPTDDTDILKDDRAKVIAEQVASDILKTLESFGLDILKAAVPMIITSLTSSIKKE